MNLTIKEDILHVLNLGRAVLEKRDSFALRELSNRTIHNASIFQDEDSVGVAVIFYSLSKIMERGKLDTKRFISLIDKATFFLEKNDFFGYKKIIKKFFEEISRIDQKFQLYIGQVVEQAQVKKGGKLYAHGVSLAQAANVLGISQWELMNYVGKTSIADAYPERMDVKKRLEFARRLFS
jgi:hypothetical protein